MGYTYTETPVVHMGRMTNQKEFEKMTLMKKIFVVSFLMILDCLKSTTAQCDK